MVKASEKLASFLGKLTPWIYRLQGSHFASDLFMMKQLSNVMLV